MKTVRRPFTCLQCRLSLFFSTPRGATLRPFHASSRLRRASVAPGLAQGSAPDRPSTNTNTARPSTAPKPIIDIKHIRLNPELYAQTCLERNYKTQSTYPAKINHLHEQWQTRQREGRHLRERSNLIRKFIVDPAKSHDDESIPEAGADIAAMSRDELLEQAKQVKQHLGEIEADESRLTAEIEALALSIPNLTSDATPRGNEPTVLSYINDNPEPEPAQSDRVWRSHVHIGTELNILDFTSAATSSGWGWYYLLNEGAMLEQALVSYALAVATRHGWGQVAPPSIVYSHIAAACGFQPRDASGEQQIYNISQSQADTERGRPELCLAGTAEIPLAGMKADATMDEAHLPLKKVAVSRCYRAEAGARGADTKGLYRVHEFTKVELFAWTPPAGDVATELFDEMLDMQTEILEPLGLHCRVLEMPTGDLGASATRKNDIEAFFPSRRGINGGWGEVTSASICTDYQTRRLATRVKTGGKMAFPWTVNGTALAVPRVLAAVLENGWDEEDMSVTVPEVLRPWMGGMEKIRMKSRLR